MERRVRVGMPKDKLMARRTRIALSYMKKHKVKASYTIVPVRQFMYKHVEDTIKELLEKRIDMVVLEYEEVMARGLNAISCGGESVAVGAVFPQNDTRSVLITRRRLGDSYDFALVQCQDETCMAGVDKRFDGVSCVKFNKTITETIDELLEKKCDAVCIGADYAKLLGIENSFKLRVENFQNMCVNQDTKAVWVALIRESDRELAELLMRCSHKETVLKLASDLLTL